MWGGALFGALIIFVISVIVGIVTEGVVELLAVSVVTIVLLVLPVDNARVLFGTVVHAIVDIADFEPCEVINAAGVPCALISALAFEVIIRPVVGTVGHVGKGIEVVAVSRFGETVSVHPVHEAVSVVSAVVVASGADAPSVILSVFVAVLGGPALEIAALLIRESGQVVQVGVEGVAIIAAMLITIDDEVNLANFCWFFFAHVCAMVLFTTGEQLESVLTIILLANNAIIIMINVLGISLVPCHVHVVVELGAFH